MVGTDLRPDPFALGTADPPWFRATARRARRLRRDPARTAWAAQDFDTWYRGLAGTEPREGETD